MATFRLTPEQAELLPSEQDVSTYEANGYYISKRGVIPAEVIERALAGAEAFYRGERDARLPVATGYCDWKPGDGDGPRNNEFVSLQKKELMELVRYPLIGAIAARLTRSASIRLLDDQLIYKPSKVGDGATATVTGWHADRAYWSTCTSDKLTTAWIPFHDVAINQSPLVVMGGSHLWSGLQDIRYFNNTNLSELEERFRKEGRRVEVIPMTLERGQLSFHHAWTVHASFPNTSGRSRLSLAVHLQDEDNRYRPYKTPQGREIHIFDEQLCRKLPSGDPDFSDPAVFPTLWSERN